MGGMRYRSCELCGCALDPGEICECKKLPEIKKPSITKNIDYIPQYVIDEKIKRTKAVRNNAGYVQLMDPVAVYDVEKADYKFAYSTFVKIGPLGWMSCGKCFLDELATRI